VRDQYGAAVGGARVLLTGNTTQSAATDANGIAQLEGLSAGEYTARIENDAYLMRVVRLNVTSREQTTLELSLTQRPPRGGIERKGQEIRVDALRFKAGSVELEPAAALGVAQLADLLLRDPTIQRVRIQGDGGESLALGRALAVKQRLVDAGVPDTRIEAAPEAAAKTTVTVLQ
jgi:outer membrane protein OmpA-like peptidoglycan-associated protein